MFFTQNSASRFIIVNITPFYGYPIPTAPEQDQYTVHSRCHRYQRHAVPASRIAPVLAGMDLPLCHTFTAVFCSLIFPEKRPGALLERRMRIREKEGVQKRVVLLSEGIFLIGFLIPGLDYRYHWSDVHALIVVAANLIVFPG